MRHVECFFQCKRDDEQVYENFVIGLDADFKTNIKLKDSWNQEGKIEEYEP